MPRYFFSLHYNSATLDKVGEQFPDDESAWRAASIKAGELIHELGDRLRPVPQWRLEVKTEIGELLYVIWLMGDRLKPSAKGAPERLSGDHAAGASGRGEAAVPAPEQFEQSAVSFERENTWQYRLARLLRRN